MQIEAKKLAKKRVLLGQSPIMHACSIKRRGKCDLWN